MVRQQAKATLKALIEIAEHERGAAAVADDHFATNDWARWCTSVDAMAERLRGKGFRIGSKSWTYTCAAGGVRSSCTSGVDGAVRNWIAAAKRKLEAAG